MGDHIQVETRTFNLKLVRNALQRYEGIKWRSDVVENENDEPIPETRIDVEIPKLPFDLGREIRFVKQPNFLSVETPPFDVETEEDKIDEEKTLEKEGRVSEEPMETIKATSLDLETPDVMRMEPTTAGQHLSHLLVPLEDFTPSIPDAITNRTLQTTGSYTTDQKIIRLVSLAAQKFMSDVATDALHLCKRRRMTPNTQRERKDGRFILSMEYLTPALSKYGITVKKPPYFV